MKFDIQHATADHDWTPALLTPQALTRFARAVEESGYAALGFTDHPAPPSRWVDAGGEGSADPFSALGFCAAVTSHVSLMTFVLVLPYRNPLLTAHQTATLDAISGGRLIVGVGTGYLRGEFQALGADFDQRREAFDEAVPLLRSYWSGEPITQPGRTFTARHIAPQPPPARHTGPPLWVHGNSAWGTERAARYGDGWYGILGGPLLAKTMRTAPIQGLDELGRRIDKLRTAITMHGRDPDAVEVVVSGHWPMLDIRKGWNPHQLQDDAAAMAELGVDRIVVIVCGDDTDVVEDTVRRFGADVINA